jgi:hypothetical protein
LQLWLQLSPKQTRLDQMIARSRPEALVHSALVGSLEGAAGRELIGNFPDRPTSLITASTA